MALALDKLKRSEDPRLLVGINTAVDAGVFLFQDGLALVQTVDLLTPMVDDPYVFGRIAAANSLSDVYAMGGKPLTALNVVGFPERSNPDWLADILSGGQDVVREAGGLVVGGHTFNEEEIKYGLAVTGTVDPDRIVTNAGSRVGDVLVLTKPLGCGVFSQAVMAQDEVDPELYEAATRSMGMLNQTSSEVMVTCGAAAATDITGYGFLGHAQEMAGAGEVRIRFHMDAIPLLPKVLELSASGMKDPGVKMNRTSFGKWVEIDEGVDKSKSNLLWESETSGGLLVALSETKAREFRKMLADKGIEAPVVGEVIEGSAGTIEVRR